MATDTMGIEQVFDPKKRAVNNLKTIKKVTVFKLIVFNFLYKHLDINNKKRMITLTFIIPEAIIIIIII